MDNKDTQNGVSLFGQSEFLMGQDPIEEIFALNLGDFISEHLISEDLAKKIGSSVKDKREGLKNQLSELISIYSLKNTLCVLSFDTKEDYAIYTSIAQSIAQMLEVQACQIYLEKDRAKGLENNELKLVLAGETGDVSSDIYQAVEKAFDTKELVFENNVTAIPMDSNFETIGVIAVYSNNEIQKEYLELVTSIASLFGTSISLQNEIDITNKLLDSEQATVGDLQHTRAELTALIGDLCDYQQAFVERLANAVDAKGQYKVSHSKNTANLARKICRELGLNEKTTDLIYYAGLLLNIGKIALPEKMFATNGKLSPEDFKRIKNHSNIGVHFLMNINFLSEVVPYITYQTERVDGSGSPEGLKGQSIPLGSRIIAVADAFSAMTSDRPYRKAMPTEQALNIMQKEAGSKWDEVVVQALTHII